MKTLWIWLVIAAGIIVGCGGSSTTGSSTGSGAVAGVVFDQTGGVVANARVWTNQGGGRTTTSNVTGSYVLTNVIGTDVVIQAEVYKGTQRYFGQNITTVYSGERSKNVNVAVYPGNALASIHGEVRDSTGLLLQGVRIFARQNTTGTVLTSAVAVSDSNGQYAINGLGAGIDYAIQANALGYGSDTGIVNLAVNENRTFNVIVPNGGSVTPATPTGFSAVAWTSPKNSTRSTLRASQLAGIKAALGYKKPSKTRDTGLGNAIEVDLYWNPVISTSTLGYGVYRATNGGAMSNIDYFRDPIGEFYADQDSALIPGATYAYAISTLSTSWSASSGESLRTSAVNVNPLGDLIASLPSVGTNVNFSWSPAIGATQYEVVIYSAQPAIGVSPVFIGPWGSATNYVYSGSDLIPGALYYFAVIGQNANGDKTVSDVLSFVR